MFFPVSKFPYANPIRANSAWSVVLVPVRIMQPKQTVQTPIPFEDAKQNTTTYIEEVMNALGSAADDRFQTE